MDLLKELADLGVDVEDGLNRMMGNAEFYRKLIYKFVVVLKNTKIDPDFDENDYLDVIEQTHALKGTAGNLSITPLFEGYGEMTNLLRIGKPVEAKRIFRRIRPIQEQIIACCERNREG